MPKDWLETLEAVGLTNVDLLRRCERRLCVVFVLVFVNRISR
jgi:hypothetical protein